MQFVSCPVAETWWQHYRQLELIPETVSNPSTTQAQYTLGLSWVWRKFIALLIAELEAENRLIEYFERCWLLDLAEPATHPSSSLHKLWVLMN